MLPSANATVHTLRRFLPVVLLLLLVACDKAAAPMQPSTPTPTPNTAPQITVPPTLTGQVLDSMTANISVTATDADGDPLTYVWTSTMGTLRGPNGNTSTNFSAVTLTPPTVSTTTPVTIQVTVTDGKGGSAIATVSGVIVPTPTQPPTPMPFNVDINGGRDTTFDAQLFVSAPGQIPLYGRFSLLLRQVDTDSDGRQDELTGNNVASEDLGSVISFGDITSSGRVTLRVVQAFGAPGYLMFDGQLDRLSGAPLTITGTFMRFVGIEGSATVAETGTFTLTWNPF